jgi:hypothetical protein
MKSLFEPFKIGHLALNKFPVPWSIPATKPPGILKSDPSVLRSGSISLEWGRSELGYRHGTKQSTRTTNFDTRQKGHREFEI